MDSVILKIAQTKLGFATLETRHRDFLDFKEVAVWQVRAALEEAYEAGFRAGQVKRVGMSDSTN